MDLEDLPGPIPESRLGQLILEAHPEKHVTILVHGGKGAGKTMFTIRVMWEVYEGLGYDEDEAYERAFNNIIFRPDEFLGRVKSIEEKLLEGDNPFEGVEPALCIDDAGVGLGGGLYRTQQKVYRELASTWQMMRTHVTGLFMTTPLPQLISDKFTGWNFRVQVRPHPPKGRYGAVAYIYPEQTDVLGLHSRVDADDAWSNEFSAYMPNEYYYPYHRKRIKFRREYRKFVMKAQEKKEKIKEKAKEKGVSPEDVSLQEAYD